MDWKGHVGQMVPSVICKGHIGHKRQLYDICDTNETGEVRYPHRPYSPAPRADHAHAQTALQMYCRNYKQAPIAQTHGLLRKARRLDKILDAVVGGDISSAASVDGDGAQTAADPHCYRCQTEFSPFFHEVTNAPRDGVKSWLCHKCHAETRKSYPVIIGIGAS